MNPTQLIADYGLAIAISVIVIYLLYSYFNKKLEDEREDRKYERAQRAKRDELMLQADKDKLEAEKQTRQTYLDMTNELKKTTQMQAEILKNQADRLDGYSDRINGNTKAIEEHNQVVITHIKKTGDRFDCVDNQLVSIAGMLDEIKHSTNDLVTKADLSKVQTGLDEYIKSKK